MLAHISLKLCLSDVKLLTNNTYLYYIRYHKAFPFPTYIIMLSA
jgi:hypothetical protein